MFAAEISNEFLQSAPRKRLQGESPSQQEKFRVDVMAKCENKFVIDKIEAICYTWNLLPFMGMGTQDYPNHLNRCAMRIGEVMFYGGARAPQLRRSHF